MNRKVADAPKPLWRRRERKERKVKRKLHLSL
jgi:hypothetical protein